MLFIWRTDSNKINCEHYFCVMILCIEKYRCCLQTKPKLRNITELNVPKKKIEGCQYIQPFCKMYLVPEHCACLFLIYEMLGATPLLQNWINLET